jgi:transposase
MLVSVDTKVDVQYKDGGVSMKGVPQGRYTKEFREEAVRLIIEDGLSLPDVGRRLSLPPSTLGNWVKAHKEGKLTGIGATRKPLTDAETELARVRRELATVKMERDILKKATAYFARESLPGTRS